MKTLLLIVAFGFLFVTVSSRLTGEVGSTSNPISGMTIAALIGTAANVVEEQMHEPAVQAPAGEDVEAYGLLKALVIINLVMGAFAYLTLASRQARIRPVAPAATV